MVVQVKEAMVRITSALKMIQELIYLSICKDNFSTQSGIRTKVYIMLQLYFICKMLVFIENIETTTLIMAINRTKEVCPKKNLA